MRPEDYIHAINVGGIICGICITGEDFDGWVLGGSFMKGFYNIHDYTTGRMGFVPHAGSQKTKPSYGVQPISNADIVTWTVTAVTVILGVVSWIFVAGGGALANGNPLFLEKMTHNDFPLSKYFSF